MSHFCKNVARRVFRNKPRPTNMKTHTLLRRNLNRIQTRNNSSMRMTTAFRRNSINIKSLHNGVFNVFNVFSPLLSKRAFSTTVSVPNMGDSITEGTLVEWTKNVGESCAVDDIVAVIETDKVTIDVRTDHAGVLTEQLAAIDDTLEVGAPLFTIDPSAAPTAVSEAPPSTPTPPTPTETPSTPAAAASTPPTPPPQASSPSPSTPPSAPRAPSVSTPSVVVSNTGGTRNENRVTMSRMRLRIAERLKEAQTNAACLTTFNEIDMYNLISMRSMYKENFEKKHGVKLGFMSAFVKASVSALQEQPAVNAYIEGKEIVYHDYCDVSVAVASPTGLVVPVIRNAESMSFADIEKEIGNYANKAKNGTLTVNEMTGGTFTISNGGVFGSLMGTPILNPPQSAILGMHGTVERPVAIKGEMVIRPMMYVALTYDHRIVDGREAVLFLRRIKDCIEDPRRLLLDV